MRRTVAGTRRRAAIDFGGIVVAAVVALVIGVVALQTMPVPDRIDRGVLRRGMLNGLLFAALVGVVAGATAIYLIARAFASFTGW